MLADDAGMPYVHEDHVGRRRRHAVRPRGPCWPTTHPCRTSQRARLADDAGSCASPRTRLADDAGKLRCVGVLWVTYGMTRGAYGALDDPSCHRGSPACRLVFRRQHRSAPVWARGPLLAVDGVNHPLGNPGDCSHHWNMLKHRVGLVQDALDPASSVLVDGLADTLDRRRSCWWWRAWVASWPLRGRGWRLGLVVGSGVWCRRQWISANVKGKVATS
jgi:hypothetical protein